jgi:hypothetical protein
MLRIIPYIIGFLFVFHLVLLVMYINPGTRYLVSNYADYLFNRKGGGSEVVAILDKPAEAAAPEAPKVETAVAVPENNISSLLPAGVFRIINPFTSDYFAFNPELPTERQKIPLMATDQAEWFVDGQKVGYGAQVDWDIVPGEHRITANNGTEERLVYISVQ